MGVHVMKRGDTAPSMVVTITGFDVNTQSVGPVDLTEASEVRVRAVQNGALLFDRDITATGQADGEATVEWQAGDTDQVGYIHCQFKVTWANGTVQTFPEDGTVRARVSLDGPTT